MTEAVKYVVLCAICLEERGWQTIESLQRSKTGNGNARPVYPNMPVAVKHVFPQKWAPEDLPKTRMSPKFARIG